MTTPAEDVATDLQTAAIGLTKGTNLFASTERPAGANVPIDCVFVFGGGGAPPERAMGQAEEIRTAVVHVRVRWSSFGGGDTKARQIQNRLQAGSINPYLDVSSIEPEPSAIGQDEDGRHLWVLSFMLTYLESKA